MEFQEVVTTLRAMRRLHPDPIPDEDIWKILDTAIMAPSGGNTQPWNFIVIKDRATKEKIAEWYLDAWNKTYGPNRDAMRADPKMVRTFNSADHLANHDGREVGVRSHDAGHDGGVSHDHALEAMQAAVLVDHRRGVRTRPHGHRRRGVEPARCELLEQHADRLVG